MWDFTSRLSFLILVSCYNKRPQNRVARTKNEVHYFPTKQSRAPKVALPLVTRGLQGCSSCHHFPDRRQRGRDNPRQIGALQKEYPEITHISAHIPFIGLNLFTWSQLDSKMFSHWVTTCSTKTCCRGILLLKTKGKMVGEELSVVSVTWGFQNRSSLLLHCFDFLF